MQLSEQELAERLAECTAPRITLDAIKDKIERATVFTDDELTIVVLRLWNGFRTVGKSAPVSAANHNQALGLHYAFEDAVRQIWPLEGYRLKTELFLASVKGDDNAGG